MSEKEPELFIEARRAHELYVKGIVLFRRADAIAQRGDVHPSKPEWREDTMNMVEENLEFSIDVLKSDKGVVFISFDSPCLRRVMVLPPIGPKKVIDLEDDHVILEVLEDNSSSYGRKATEDDIRQFGELLIAFDMRRELTNSLGKSNDTQAGHPVSG